MHHFIYPSQDTFITNETTNDETSLNYGIDEILLVGTDLISVSNIASTTRILYGTQSVAGWCVSSFDGIITNGTMVVSASSLIGTSSFATGSDSVTPNISASVTGSLTQFSGSIWNFTGRVVDLTGKIITASIAGYDTIPLPHNEVTNSTVLNRALVQFDIAAISQSIASGDITNPKFHLKIKVARAETLPIQYSLLAYPIGESWVMGNGYVWDGGSDTGASWIYRDYNTGTAWSTPGGTVLSPVVSQSFNYEVGDVYMDVTPIVNNWLNGTSANNGILIKSSDESQVTSSGMLLRFFSNDSNTIYRPVLDVAWDDSTIVTQTSSTSSVSIGTHEAGFYGVVSGNSQVTGISISGSFAGIGNIVVDVNNSASGIVIGSGSFGFGYVPIYGTIVGSVSSSVETVYQITQSCPPNIYSTASVSQSLLMAVFVDGTFSGSWFTASWDGYNLSNGSISGSWNSTFLSGSGIISSSAITLWPTIVSARFDSPYFSGDAVGGVTNTDSASYGIFTGTLITDVYNDVLSVVLPFSGSIFLVDTLFTSSVTIVSHSLEPVQLDKPFVAIIQDLKPTVRAGNIIRVNVFGREEFPLKNFGRSTQFSQFLTPKYLPVSSSYAIKDNQTEEIVVDFDNYTRLSCDMNGNYFLLDTTGLPQERYFRVLLKIEQSGSIYTIDSGNIFKIVR